MEDDNTGGGLDIAAASASIGADLGFGPADEGAGDDDLGLGGDLDGGAAAPSPSPAPPPAATAAPVATSAPVAGPAASPAPTAAPSAGPAVPARFTADTAPSTWSPAAAAGWAALPPDVRAEIAKRENDMFTGLEGYKADAGFAKTIKGIVAPVMPHLQAANVRPEQFLGNMMQSYLRLGDPSIPTADRIAFGTQLLKSFGLELPAVQAAAGPAAAPGVEPSASEKALLAKIDQLESRLNGTETHVRTQQQAVADEHRNKVTDEVTKFADDPANEYFLEVADDISLLIKASGGKLSLKDAYERAVRSNPVTWAKESAKLTQAAVEKARKEDADRAAAAAAARKGRVRTSGHSGSGTAASTSMDDTMAATLAAIRKKEGS